MNNMVQVMAHGALVALGWVLGLIWSNNGKYDPAPSRCHHSLDLYALLFIALNNHIYPKSFYWVRGSNNIIHNVGFLFTNAILQCCAVLFCYSAVMFYYSAALFYYSAVLLQCSAVLLQCCSVTVQCCSITVLFSYSAVLFYYSAVLLQCSAVLL